MKKYITIYISLLITFLAFWGFSMLPAEAANPHEVVTEYFVALKNGNTEAAKNLLSENFYQKRKGLLKNNRYYSEFLKKFYEASRFHIVNTVQKNARAYVDVEQTLKDGSKNTVALTLQEDKPGDWRIAEETIKP